MAMILKNLRSWKECLSIVKFAYNQTIHSATSFSPSEVVYRFNPLTLLDLSYLPLREQVSIYGV